PDIKPYFHLDLLATNRTGNRNLVKLSSLGYTEGFYYKQRGDRELLERYGEGLIVSSACMAGELASHLLVDHYDAAREAASWYAERFPGRYYLEVQAHRSEGQEKLNERIFALASDLSLPVIATNDSHFLKAENHDAHDVLLCIGLGKDREDRDRMRYDRGLYFKSHVEIGEHFPNRPDVLENTLLIADRCSLALSKQVSVPSFPLPPEATSENDLLVRLSTDGAHAKYGNPLPPNVKER